MRDNKENPLPHPWHRPCSSFPTHIEVEQAATSPHREWDIGETSLVARVDSIILLPTTSNQPKSGSVRDLRPEPSDKGDLEAISCRTSDAAMKMEPSRNDGSRSSNKEWNGGQITSDASILAK